MELVAPFGDMRPPFKDLSNEEIFWMLSGEDKHSVKIGRKVEAKIRFASEEAAMGNIPELNNAEAVIEAASVSSKQHVANCRDYFRPGDTVVGAIIAIDMDNALVYLSTASTQLNSDLEYENQYLAQMEEYYIVPDKETLQQEEARLKGTKLKPKITMRPIRHPYFKNVTAAEATAEVLAGPVGVAVIRPAAKSFKRLYITMCMPSGMVMNVGIKELGAPKSNLTLSGPLEVEPIPGHKFEYEDLDELVVRFIDPIAAAMRALSTHRKWRGGPENGPAKSWEEIQDELRLEKESATFTGYCLAPDTQRPGAFFIAHHIGPAPRREYFVVLPDGFYFRKKMYGTVEHMLASFKRNPAGITR
jgi:transcription elongation factor SPT6